LPYPHHRRTIHKLRTAFSGEWRGEKSAVLRPALTTAENAREWQELWQATFSHLQPLPACPKLPEGKMAIGIFAGATTDPLAISVSGITSSGGTTTIDYQMTPREAFSEMQRAPYLLKFIDKTADKIVFRRASAPAAPAQRPPVPA